MVIEYLVLWLRVGLAAVFALAGLSKLQSRGATRSSLADFGVPSALRPAVALLLPAVELVIAVGLLTDVPSLFAWAAVVLLTAFSIGMARLIWVGRRPQCNCFGGLSKGRVGYRAILRNAVLVSMGLAIVGVPPASLATILRPPAAIALAPEVLTVLLVASWFAIGALAIATQEARRRPATGIAAPGAAGSAGSGPAPSRPEHPSVGLPIGTSAPSFALRTPAGNQVTVGWGPDERRDTALVFLDPGCSPCEALMPRLGPALPMLQRAIRVVILSNAAPEKVQEVADAHELGDVLIDEHGRVGRAYRYPGTPSAVIVGRDGLVRTRPASGPEAVAELLLDAAGTDARRDLVTLVPTKPQPAPGPSIGQRVDLDWARSREGDARHTLAVFWSGACRYSRELAPDLERFFGLGHAAPMRLVVVDSTPDQFDGWPVDRTGDEVIRDPDLAISHEVGIHGTPIGIVLDHTGRILVPRLAGVGAIREAVQEPLTTAG